MLPISLRLCCEDVSINKVCNNHPSAGKLVISLIHALSKECIGEDVSGNMVVTQHTIICFNFW